MILADYHLHLRFIVYFWANVETWTKVSVPSCKLDFRLEAQVQFTQKLKNLLNLKQIKVSLNFESIAHQLAKVASWL